MDNEVPERRVKAVAASLLPPGSPQWVWCDACGTFHRKGASVAQMERDWDEVQESRAWLAFLQVEGRFLVTMDWLRDWRPEVPAEAVTRNRYNAV